MSDFENQSSPVTGGQAPPPPAYGQTPPPPAQAPPAYGQAPPAGYQQPASAGYGVPYPPQAGVPKGPRPKALIPGLLMILGAAVAIIGTVLPWSSGDGDSLNGYDDYLWFSSGGIQTLENPAVFVVIGAVIMLGLGIATLAAGRVLAVTIIGIISAVLGVLGGGGLLVLIVDFSDQVGISTGIGVILQPIAPIISLGGAIWATATRRKPAPGY